MDQLLQAWESVTLGQAVIVAIAAALLIKLTEIIVDGARTLMGRRTAAQADDVTQLVEHTEEIRNMLADLPGETLAELRSIDRCASETAAKLDEHVEQARAIRAACERIADAAGSERAGSVV